MRQTNQAILNQPFEFDEVLVGPQVRRSFQHAGALEGAFGSPGVPSLPPDTPTRKIAIRLRTINNACAAPFETADGLPVTEVSIYGSRDRQFLIGPYWAVSRVMEGTLPGDGQSELVSTLDGLCQVLESILGLVDAFLSDPDAGSTKARIDKAQQDSIDQAERERLATTRYSRPISRCPSEEQIEYWVRREQQIDLSVERIDEIREF